jgi:hypothetical protein
MKRDSTGPTSQRSSIGESNTISEPIVCSMQTMHLSWGKISTISKRTELSLQARHLGVPTGASKTISEPMVHLAQTVHPSCVKISTISKRTELSLEPRQLVVPSSASKMISEPVVRLAQTMHYLPPTLTLSLNRKKRDSTWPTPPRSFIGWVQNDFRAYGMFNANRAPILLLD